MDWRLLYFSTCLNEWRDVGRCFASEREAVEFAIETLEVGTRYIVGSLETRG